MVFHQAKPRVAASTLPTVIAWGEARFPAEKMREVAGSGVAHVEGNIHHALLRFPKQSSREIHPQIDVILRRRHPCGTLEKAVEVKLAQPELRGQLIQIEFIRNVFGHPVGDLSHLEAGQ